MLISHNSDKLQKSNGREIQMDKDNRVDHPGHTSSRWSGNCVLLLLISFT